ncbi:response regulator [Paenibacillus xanthanilyticus]|uniref:Response regulator n=1 Tax=Paenibacillus xanthanilyticus TaxID=1783531 RepID=A0ABV8K9J3_9BACL
MHSVMIVDDEPTIHEGLKALIEWERLGFVVVDTAGNAKEALAKYRLHKPGLMIVDIRMPGMDGLELIQILKRDNARLHVLVLSGYADFSYAQRAISLGIDGYLLKPVDEDEMSEHLAKLKMTMDDEIRMQAEVPSELWNQERLLREILTGRITDDSGTLRRTAKEVGMLWNGFQVVLLLPHALKSDPPLSQDSIRAGLSSLYERNGRGIVFSAEPYVGILLRDGISGASARRQLLADLQMVAEAEHCVFTVAAGERTTRIEEIRRSYAIAQERMRQRFFRVGEIIGPEPPPLLPEPTPDPVALSRLEGLADKLVLATETGNTDVLSRQLEEAGRLMLQAGEGETSAKARFMQMLTHVLERLALKHTSVRKRSQEFSGRVLAIERSQTYAVMLKSIADLLADMASDAGSDTQETCIRRMIDLINRNYKENLKLETIAEALNYNSSYLGKLFKSQTGDHFNTYRDKVRIGKAKELLEQGMRVYEVADQVGLSNVNYFHAKFRKYVGMSPTQFRENMD